MQIEDFKTWQWVLVGLIAGVLFSCVLAWRGPAFDSLDLNTIDTGEFEQQAYVGTNCVTGAGPTNWLTNQYHKGQPFLRDLLVHPPLAGDTQHRYWITGREYSINEIPKDPAKPAAGRQVVESWKPFKYAAPAPYVPGYELEEQKLGRKRGNLELVKQRMGGKESFPTVLDYLKTVKSLQGSTVSYHFAWYELPAAMWALPPVAGVLLIGCAWPLALGVMQNYGMAKPPTVKVKPAAKPKPVVKGKKPAAVSSAAAGVVFKPVTPQPKPVEAEHKEYGGEYYPVVKPVHKEDH